MIFLLLGFITPAILCTIFGIIACLRRTSFVAAEDVEEGKEYELLDGNTHLRLDPNVDVRICRGDGPTSYQNALYVRDHLPPSYSETIGLSDHTKNPNWNAPPPVPPNQPRVRSDPAVKVVPYAVY